MIAGRNGNKKLQKEKKEKADLRREPRFFGVILLT